MADEVFSIIMRVQGESDVERLRGEIEKAESEVNKLAATLKGQGLSASKIASSAGMQKYGRDVADLVTQLKAAEKQVQRFGGSTKGFNGGMALLELSRAVEDVQFGLAGAVNQVPGFVAALGGGAGLAAVISLVAVASAQLVKHWGDLQALMGNSKVRTEAEEMAELAKKTKLTADEAERLYSFKEREGKTKELREGKTESEKKAEDIATKAIIEGDPRRIMQGVLATAPEKLDSDAGVVAARKELEDLRKKPIGTVNAKTGDRTVTEAENIAHDAAINEGKRKVIESLRTAAEKIVSFDSLVQLFPGGPKELSNLIKSNPGAFGPHAGYVTEQLDLADMQSKVTPEQRDRKKADEAWEKEDKSFEENRKKAAEENRRIDKLYEDDAKQEFQAKEDERKKSERIFKELDAWDKEIAKQAIDDAKENMPGIEGALGIVAEDALRAGGDPEAIRQSLAESLKGAVDDETAASLAGDALVKSQKGLLSESLKGDNSMSATIGGVDFANAIQAGVGGDKQLGELQRHTELLKALVGGLKQKLKSGDGKVRPN